MHRLLTAVVLLLAAASATAADLTVSAAASLTDAFTTIGKRFEAVDAGTTVRFNFAASGALLQQIANGAPVDVLATADEETMDDAARRRLVVDATRIDFTGNRLVVVVPADARTTPASLADLRRDAFARIAIGVPASVPVGRYTKAVLEEAGLWSTLSTKTIGAQSVRQALDYVARGEVDAGFVYATDASVLRDRVRVAFVVPTPVPIRYPAAVVADAPNRAAAERFVRYLRSPEAQAVLAAAGFVR